jgi:putative flippase GtrA
VPPAIAASRSSPQSRSSKPLFERTLPRNVLRFGLVGTAGLCFDASLFMLLAGHSLPEPFARAIALTAATVLTWRLNRRFTFGESARRDAFEGGCYGMVALCAQGLNFIAFLALRAALPDTPALVSLFAAAACAALFSYTGQRFVTFRGRIRT